MRLYEVTEEPRYPALTNYFVEQRGAQPHYYDQNMKARQTSHWHTYGPAWMVKDKAYSQHICPSHSSKPPLVTRYVLST